MTIVLRSDVTYRCPKCGWTISLTRAGERLFLSDGIPKHRECDVELERISREEP